MDVKAKNGVTLLGVTPKADGTLPDAQVQILKKLGAWMQVNKEALHGSECRVPCASGRLRFMRKGDVLYVIDLESTGAPRTIPGVIPIPGSKITMLGSPKALRWRQEGEAVVIEELPDPLPCDHACVFRIKRSGASQ